MQARQITLTSLVRSTAMLNGRRVALIDGDIRISYTQLERRTNSLANHLLAQGLRPGDRIALLLLDGAPLIELLIAAGKIGAIAMMLNWRLSAPEIAHIMGDGDPQYIFHSQRFEGLLPDTPGRLCCCVTDQYDASGRYHALATQGSDWLSPQTLPGASPLYMMYTSGTTGKPKGCLQSSEGAAIYGLAFAARLGLGRDDCLLSISPLFHVGGLSHCLAAIAAGNPICFVPRDCDGEALLRFATENRCSFTTMNKSLLNARSQAGALLAGRLYFRLLSGGAGMANPGNFKWVHDEWNAELVGGYGQTEVGGYSTLINYPDMLEHPTALGWPMPQFDMTILDADGQPLWEPDAEGEIGVRGPSVMLGYWNNPEASEAALGTGWLRSGDMGRRDALGLFHMLGRSKELIKTGGENVYPKEVEAPILKHPAVADAAVAGVKDLQWGEAVKAFIVLKPGQNLSPDEVVSLCRDHIAGYKRPRYVEYLDEIPRDAVGKILRRMLSDRPVTPDQAVG